MGRTSVGGHFSRVSHVNNSRPQEPTGRYARLNPSENDFGSQHIKNAVNDQQRRAELTKLRLQHKLAKKNTDPLDPRVVAAVTVLGISGQLV